MKSHQHKKVMTPLEFQMVWRSIDSSINRYDYDTRMFAEGLGKYLKTNHFSDISEIDEKEAIKLSMHIMDKLKNIITSMYNIEFNIPTNNYVFDVLDWVNKVIHKFHLRSIEDFKYPRIFKIELDGSIWINKFMRHHEHHVEYFDNILAWYNLAKSLNPFYWVKITLENNTDCLGFKTYLTNPINGLLYEVYYSLLDYTMDPHTTKVIPTNFIKNIQQFKS